MATINRFQDIEAWQKARELTRDIYACSKTGPFSRDFALRDQMRKAALSIMSNIAEGFGRDGKLEFIQFLSIAKGSATELESQLYVAFDQKYISEKEFENLMQLTRSTQNLIGGLIRYLKASKIKGAKFKK